MTETHGTRDAAPGNRPSLPHDEVLLASVEHVGELLKTRALSPVELTKAALNRVNRLNPRLRAFVHVAAAEALEAATQSEKRHRRGEALGPWDGIPVSVKDICAVAGLPLEAGSAVLRGHVAAYDAEIVRVLRGTGAVILGKTSLDEFALSTSGPARNPLNTALSPGGSSGGAAVAVATGMSFADIATDTGGSVRIPAHCCGVVGLKPTHSLLPLDGIVPLAHSLDHVGILTRTLGDSASFLAALQPGDGPAVPADVPALSSLRVGVVPQLPIRSDAVRRDYEHLTQVLRAEGADVREVSLPNLDAVSAVHMTVLSAEMSRYHRQRFGPKETRYGDGMTAVCEIGADVSTEAYTAAREARGELCRAIDRLLEDVDVLALPTLLIDVPEADRATVTIAGIEQLVTPAMVRLTSLFNHTGHPAVTVPLAANPGEQPSSVQLVAPYHQERRLLAAAQRIRAGMASR
ncbi:amidase [Embleya sp. NPDC050154]|uniref:amidase n=1 Tax=Embleya sp. NPDC050154 TaxID=3363988 RepID=UPI0037B4AECD